MSMGHIMIDLDDVELSEIEKELLKHPQVGGIILFARNYESKKQLCNLTSSIRKIFPECLIAVDQEGGRVQRFKNEFTLLPSFSEYGKKYQLNPDEAKQEAQRMALVMATELLSCGVNVSFTPVLDLDYGLSEVIGSRSFHSNTEILIDLASSFIQGMHEAGMPATGKHFPGHGAVKADSHLTLPVDSRPFNTIYQEDLQPFLRLNTALDAIMPAHILYDKIDDNAACFSPFWLQEVLRNRLAFTGVIFSDDLSMGGAKVVGDHVQRTQQAFKAGCDMVLICNERAQAILVLDELENYENQMSQKRLQIFRAKSKI